MVIRAAARAGFDVRDGACMDAFISAVTDVTDRYSEQEIYHSRRNVYGDGHEPRYIDHWVPGHVRSMERHRARESSRERSPDGHGRYIDRWVPGRARSAERTRDQRRFRERSPDSHRRYIDRWVPGRTRSTERMRGQRPLMERGPSPAKNRRSQYWENYDAQRPSRTQRSVELPAGSEPPHTFGKPSKLGPQKAPIIHDPRQLKMICDAPKNVSLQAPLDPEPTHAFGIPSKLGPQKAPIIHNPRQAKMICDIPKRVSLWTQEDLHPRPGSLAISDALGRDQAQMIFGASSRALLPVQGDLHQRPMSLPGFTSRGKDQFKTPSNLSAGASLQSPEHAQQRCTSPPGFTFRIEKQSKMISDLPPRALLRAQEDLHERFRNSLDSIIHPEDQFKGIFNLPAPPLLQAQKTTAAQIQSKIVYSGANALRLGERVRKRSAPTADSETTSRQPLKMRRLDDPEMTESTVIHDGLLVKLNKATERGPYHHNRPVLTALNTNTNTRTVSGPMDWEPSNPITTAAARRRQRQRAGQRKRLAATNAANSATTRKTFKKVKTWLEMSATRVQELGKELSARWEGDSTLQDGVTMGQLSELNGYFGQIEHGIAGAVVLATRFSRHGL